MPKVRKLSKDEVAAQHTEAEVDEQPKQPLSRVLDQQFPHLSAWIQAGECWVEFGTNDYSRSLIRILDIGGMLWESDQEYETLDALLQAAEDALAELEANGSM